MTLTVPVAHDFICPWCYVALSQKKRLESEFDVKIVWKAYELFPEELEWPEPGTTTTPNPNRPPVPSRFEFLCLADGITMPATERPRRMRTNNAHNAAEYAYSVGVGDELVEALYQALYERGEEINQPRVILSIAKGIVPDLEALERAVETHQFNGEITKYDDDAYAAGVYNVPTYFVVGQRLAEQPYVVLQKAIAAVASRRE